MLLYDWKKIYQESGGNSTVILRILKMMTFKEIPRSKKDPIYYLAQKNFSGSSFLLHADIILDNRYKHTNKEIAEYAALASIRPLSEYYASGDLTLNLLYCPVDEEVIVENSLLYIVNDEIHFLYEQAENSTKH